ncbi:MAG TPA: hypothetical protein VNM72_03675 [Blastocatellia bacterium]|nr:hypothetical protein [Blastocatellia bacterium]
MGADASGRVSGFQRRARWKRTLTGFIVSPEAAANAMNNSSGSEDWPLPD